MKINEIAALIVLYGRPGKIRAQADHTSAPVLGGTGTSRNSDWGLSSNDD
jgi:hypothetical protein